MAKKTALGSALDSIFDDVDGFDGGLGIQTLKIGEIEPNREQPRKDFDPEKIKILAESIANHGLIQPLTVRPLNGEGASSGGVYQIVAGERRWRAAREAGLTEVPVRVMELTDAQTMQIALIENLQREDLNPIEEATGYRELMDCYGMKQDEVAAVVGKARSSVTNSLRLLTLPGEVLELVKKNVISKGHCKAIMAAQSTERVVQLARRVAAGELSVRETERLAKEENLAKKRTPKKKKPFFAEAEIALSQSLNTTVRIVSGGKKNTLCIEFADEDELRDIIKKF
ncbi:MAG: ParB/RepB/Spo0J family partition protein [Oscillospiraceae bacterium]|jgi:ParB family chromosome partitioning protein|nr:ParB/RepB/Spo0J family partition protein [Oscillospiraceae bacterium]